MPLITDDHLTDIWFDIRAPVPPLSMEYILKLRNMYQFFEQMQVSLKNSILVSLASSVSARENLEKEAATLARFIHLVGLSDG